MAATLLLAMPLVAFLKTNDYPLATAETALLLAACVAAGALLGLCSARLPLGAVLVFGIGAALCIDLMYGSLHSKTALAIVLLGSLALAAALRRHLAVVVGAAASVFIASTLLIPGTIAREQPRPGAEPAAHPAQPPVLVHLILDEHIGVGGLPQELPESAELARWLTDSYLRQGFRLHAGAYSEYFDSRNSIANLLNFSSDANDWAHLAEGKEKPYVLSESAYFRHLTERGYRLRIYQSDYLDYCRVPGVAYAACSRYRANSIGALPATPLRTLERSRFIFNSLAESSNYLKRLRSAYGKLRAALGSPALPAWDQAVSRVGPLAVLPVLRQLENDLRSASRGQAYFAHLLIPHYPYVLDEGCRVRERIAQWLYIVAPDAPSELQPNTAATRVERYRNYFAQVRCQQQLLERLFEAMKEAGVWHDAIVIVHGDHGSRILRNTPVMQNAKRLTEADLNDAFSTLFAAKLPGSENALVGTPRPLQALLGEALGVPGGPASGKVYLRDKDDKRLIAHRLPGFPGHDAAD